MRHHFFCFWIFLLLGCVPPATSADQPEALPKLRERAEAARGGDRARLFAEAARRDMETANDSFTNGEVDKAHALVKDSVADAQKAADAAIQSGHRLKQTEIELRKLRRRTEEIRHSLAFDDRPQLEAAEQQMDEILQNLLKKVFAK